MGCDRISPLFPSEILFYVSLRPLAAKLSVVKSLPCSRLRFNCPSENPPRLARLSRQKFPPSYNRKCHRRKVAEGAGRWSNGLGDAGRHCDQGGDSRFSCSFLVFSAWLYCNSRICSHAARISLRDNPITNHFSCSSASINVFDKVECRPRKVAAQLPPGNHSPVFDSDHRSRALMAR